jgi:hypothetical protein
MRATTIAVRDRQQAEIILVRAKGLTQGQIAARLGMYGRRRTVSVSASWPSVSPGWTMHRARAQAVVAACGGAHGVGQGRVAARYAGPMELPNDGVRGQGLAGERATSVGGKRHQAAPFAHQRPLTQ